MRWFRGNQWVAGRSPLYGLRSRRTPNAHRNHWLRHGRSGYRPLATKIVFGREIREASERIGANHHDVVKAMSLDPRIGGGEEWWRDGLYDECLPKDLDAFITWLRGWDVDRELLETVSQLGRPTLHLVE